MLNQIVANPSRTERLEHLGNVWAALRGHRFTLEELTVSWPNTNNTVRQAVEGESFLATPEIFESFWKFRGDSLH
jgi:hypothetical protein